jgi:putative transposase
MKRLRLQYDVRIWCQVLAVSRSGYYAWVSRKPSTRAQENARLEIAIKAAHERTRRSYGPERLHKELQTDGYAVGVCRIKQLRNKLGLRCAQRRRFKATTTSDHNLSVAPNLLAQHFAAHRPNQVWVTDITYIPTDEGWLYLAGIKDLYTRQLVGYAMGERMTQALVAQALFQAVAIQRPPAGLVHHSDRGSQYCSPMYQRILAQFGMTASMSRRGNCYDNAPMESFWGTLKTELIHRRRYSTRQCAQQEITEYIEIFYNRQRRHSRLGYLSPAAYAQQYYRTQQSA